MSWESAFSKSAGALVGLVLLTSCGGAGSAPGPIVAGQSSRLQSRDFKTTPKQLSFNGLPQQKAAVSIVGGTAPYSIKQSNSEIANISTATQSGSTWGFTVTPVAGGKTTVTVMDAKGREATVSVEEVTCEPPTPAFFQMFPKSGSKRISANVGQAYMASPAKGGYNDLIPDFFVRFVASNGSYLSGGNLKLTRAPPPKDSERPPYRDYTTHSHASLPNAKNATTYKVQVADANIQCLPPFFTGGFSTSAR